MLGREREREKRLYAEKEGIEEEEERRSERVVGHRERGKRAIGREGK